MINRFLGKLIVLGAAASKPVMEGKAVLFKRYRWKHFFMHFAYFSFGGVDSFDIEINESDPQKFIDIVVSLEPTFGGINLEDIKVTLSHNFFLFLYLDS